MIVPSPTSRTAALLLAACVAACRRGPPAPPDPAQVAAARAAELRRQLVDPVGPAGGNRPPGERYDCAPNYPPIAISQMRAFREAMREWIVAEFDHAPAFRTPSEITDRMQPNNVRIATVPTFPRWSVHEFGDYVLTGQVRETRLGAYAGVLVAFAVPCTEDDTLYLFARDAAGRWRFVLGDEEQAFRGVAEGRARPQWAVGGAPWKMVLIAETVGVARPPMVLTRHVRVRLLALVDDPLRPRTVLEEERDVGVEENGPGYTVEATDAGFVLHFLSPTTGPTAPPERREVRYVVGRGGISRVPARAPDSLPSS